MAIDPGATDVAAAPLPPQVKTMPALAKLKARMSYGRTRMGYIPVNCLIVCLHGAAPDAEPVSDLDADFVHQLLLLE